MGIIGAVVAGLFLLGCCVGFFAGRDYQRHALVSFLRGVYWCEGCCPPHAAVCSDLLGAWGYALRADGADIPTRKRFDFVQKHRRPMAALLFVLLLVGAASAQEKPLPVKPEPKPAASIPSDSLELPKPAKWEYALWAGLSGASHYAVQRDVSSTEKCLRLVPGCREETGFARPFANSGNLGAAAHGATAAVNGLSLWMLKSNRMPWRAMWWVPQVALAVVPHFFANRNKQEIRGARR